MLCNKGSITITFKFYGQIACNMNQVMIKYCLGLLGYFELQDITLHIRRAVKLKLNKKTLLHTPLKTELLIFEPSNIK